MPIVLAVAEVSDERRLCLSSFRIEVAGTAEVNESLLRKAPLDDSDSREDDSREGRAKLVLLVNEVVAVLSKVPSSNSRMKQLITLHTSLIVGRSA